MKTKEDGVNNLWMGENMSCVNQDDPGDHLLDFSCPFGLTSVQFLTETSAMIPSFSSSNFATTELGTC